MMNLLELWKIVNAEVAKRTEPFNPEASSAHTVKVMVNCATGIHEVQIGDVKVHDDVLMIQVWD